MQGGRKGFADIVMIVLLLLVVVLVAISFQSWFMSDSSRVLGDVERELDFELRIDGIVRDRVHIYAEDSFEILSIQLGEEDCMYEGEIGVGVSEIVLRCGFRADFENLNLVLFTNKGTFSRSFYLSENIFCPLGYIRVPADNYFSEKDFCVMIWHAKAYNSVSEEIVASGCDGGCTAHWADDTILPVSVPEGMPWRQISMNHGSNYDALQACSDIGEGYKLITNREWMSIARNIESNSNNWDGGEVGSGTLSRGWSGRTSDDGFQNTGPAPNGSLDCLYNIGADVCDSSGSHLYKRTHELSNGEILWDIAGNIYSWVDAMEDGSVVSTGNACGGTGWYSFFGNDGFAECSFQNGYAKSETGGDIRFEVGPLGNYNADQAMGRIYSSTSSNRGFRRGGYWLYGTRAGIYELDLSSAITETHLAFSFRCTYAP